ncbi:hypothetical protein [Sulfitobacter dubius]|uniref:hypothetical protein n=1 Tax=Sulfitobacter dubius TaxID=218673 RepID=UPI0030D87AFE
MPIDQSTTVTKGAAPHRCSLFWPASFPGALIQCLLLAAINLPLAATVQAQPVTDDGLAELADIPAGDATVINTAKPAIPSAQEVIQDLPSALHLSRHQRGEINGLRYVLFPDGTGTVMQADELRSPLFRMSCEKGVACTVYGEDGETTLIPAVGAPEPDMPSAPSGKVLARYLSEWILAGTGTPPVVEPAPPPPSQIDDAVPDWAEGSEPADPEDKPSDLSTDTEATPAAPQEPDSSEITAFETEVTPVDAAQQVEEILPAPVEQPAHLPCTIEDPDVDCSEQQLEKLSNIEVVQTAKQQVKTAASPAKRTASTVKAIDVAKIPVSAPTPPEKETFFQRVKLACSITGSVTLRYKHHSTGAKRFGKPRASLNCGAQLSEKLTLRASVIGYGDNNEKSPFDAEFTYALSYKATDKITLSYSNYSARFDSANGSFFDSLISGALRASYRFPKIKLPNDKTIGCSSSVNLLDLEYSSFNLFCSYALTERLRISGTAYAYLPGKQDVWDPDFSYAASYKISDDWSVTYSNYGNNRFFWNPSSTPGEGVWGGTVSVAYKFKF